MSVFVSLTCDYCGATFPRQRSAYNQFLRRRNKYTFCNKECARLHRRGRCTKPMDGSARMEEREWVLLHDPRGLLAPRGYKLRADYTDMGRLYTFYMSCGASGDLSTRDLVDAISAYGGTTWQRNDGICFRVPESILGMLRCKRMDR